MEDIEGLIARSMGRLNALLDEARSAGRIEERPEPQPPRSARRHPSQGARAQSSRALDSNIDPERMQTAALEPAEVPRLRKVEVSKAGPADLPSDRPPQRSRPRVPSRIVRISHSPPSPEVRVPTRIVRVTPPNEVNPSQVEDDEVDPGALDLVDGEGNDSPLASQATHQRGSRRSHKLHWKPPPPESFNSDSKQDLNTWLGTVELYAYNAHVPDREKAEMAAGYLTGNAARAFLNACSAAKMRCITDWDTICDVLRSDFGQIFESDQARNKLEKLGQTGRADGFEPLRI